MEALLKCVNIGKRFMLMRVTNWQFSLVHFPNVIGTKMRPSKPLLFIWKCQHCRQLCLETWDKYNLRQMAAHLVLEVQFFQRASFLGDPFFPWSLVRVLNDAIFWQHASVFVHWIWFLKLLRSICVFSFKLFF